MSEHAVREEIRVTDGDLLARLNDGNVTALEALYDRYSGYVHGLALRILGAPEEADEITQDVFWQLWKRKLRYDATRGRFSTWLFAVTRNRCIDRIRHQTRRPQASPIDADVYSASTNTPEEDVYLGERRRLVLQAVSGLPKEQQEAVELCFFHGLTHMEVAARLDEPLGTVKSRIRMGVQKLKSSLSPETSP